MKNIYNKDGLSREDNSEKISIDLPLQVLEEKISVLLERFIRISGDRFKSYYRFQPLLILSEIENYDLSEKEEKYRNLPTEKEKEIYTGQIINCLEDWRKRLEYACIHSENLQLLTDLNNLIQTTVSPYLPVYQTLFPLILTTKEIGYIWLSAKPKNITEIVEKGFQRRFLFLLFSCVSELKKNINTYKEEILSLGTMDPSLAVILSFLNNYSEIATRFNANWKNLPLYYIRKILMATFPEKEEEVIRIPYETANHNDYELLTEPGKSTMKLEKMEMIMAGKNKERYPEAALNYITGLVQSSVPAYRYTSSLIGIRLLSNVFLLNEGERKGTIICKITDESVIIFENLIDNVATEEKISKEESLFKILFDSFFLKISTATGWTLIDNYTVKYNSKEKQLLFVFYLSTNFPAAVPCAGLLTPGIEILLNSSAWLYPYSWVRQILIKSIHIKVEVKEIRNIVVYNELGLVDSQHPFVPFGIQTGKGAWMAFGNYEIATKHLSKLELYLNWLNLPTNKHGLKEYYAGYESKIDNNSFRVQTSYLQDYKWKTEKVDNIHYLFQSTRETNINSQTNKKLSGYTIIPFLFSEYKPLKLSTPEDYQPGNIPSGFYRIMIESPEIGFGEKEYRRLFTEIMITNSRKRKIILPPEPPISPLVDAPRLSYSADQNCFFAIGEIPAISIAYISPLSKNADLLPDITKPVALMEGPVDEGNLIIWISGTTGENLISMYIEMELLQREVDHNSLPEISWYYKNGTEWIKIKPTGILIDETDNFMHSGRVEIQLPFPVSTGMLDENGFFRMCASAEKNLCNSSRVKNIYFNVVEAKRKNKRPVKENEREIRKRIREKITHRNRALLSQDYEQMVLSHFPEIVKVKCLSGKHSLQIDSETMVTLVLIHHDDQETHWPLCDAQLLFDVEKYIYKQISPFAKVHAINPDYEEITVFCGITVKKGKTTGAAISQITRLINEHISPWIGKDKIPVFGHSFSLRELEGNIKQSPLIENLHGIKIIHLTKDTGGSNFLNEYSTRQSEEPIVSPSKPWAILIPAIRQYVIICEKDQWEEKIEYGDLEIEQTFIIQ